MKFKSPLYYCNECKTILPSLDKLLFVEEKTTKGFCSEVCIEDFYSHIIYHFEKIEQETRTRLEICDEKISTKLGNKELTENVLASPDEIWMAENELDETIHTYIKHFSKFSAVVICKVYDNEASFVFLSTSTSSREFLSEIRAGKKINRNELEAEEDIDEDAIFIQLLENKKSKLLAELLDKRKNSDISFENFMDYEYCFSEVLENPDEVFENHDNEGDCFFIYIKSYLKNKENFFYIISCLKRKGDDQSKEISVFPVLAFPTNDLNLYSKFRAGKKISSGLKN